MNAVDEMKTLKQWVNWENETRQGIDGTPYHTKVLKNPRTGNNASSTAPSTWATYEDAKAKSDKIGFVFTEAAGIIGVDIDGCVTNGIPNEKAKEITKTLDSYTEYSPSGSGLHIYMKGEIPRGFNNKKQGVEMYSHSRFFTVTEIRYHDAPATLGDNQEGLTKIFEKYKTRDPDTNIAPGKITPSSKRANKYGNTLEEIRRDDKLDRLLNNDNRGYPSPSEADMAAAQKLYFYAYTDDEIAGIIREHRPRAKLKRKDYLRRTISKIRRGEQIGGPLNEKVTDIMPNIAAETEDPEESIKTLKLQKYERLIPKYEKLVKEVQEEFKIITFTDTREMWIYNPEKGHYTREAEPKIRVYLDNTLKKYYRKRDAIEVIHQVQNKTFTDRLTARPPDNLLNLENGVLNLETLELTPSTPDHFFTSRWPVRYYPDAKHGEFRKFLEGLKLTKPKKLQRFTGYILIPTNKYKKALLIHGPTDTGKTTFLRVIKTLIGSHNYCSIGLQRLERRFQLRRLYGKRLNIYGDLDSRAFTAISAFKTTTGSDPLEAEVKGSNRTITFTWEGKHIFIANALPEAKGEADADEFYNRLVLVEFTEQITPADQDKNLVEKMTTPEELSDVLNWAIQGLQDLEKNKGFDAEEIEKIREHYKRAASPVYSFTQDHCEVDAQEKTTKEESYTTFIKYCHHYGLPPKSKTRFYEDLLRHCPGIMSGRKQVNGKSHQAWIYLKLINLELLEETPPQDHQQPQIDQYNT